MGTAIKHRVPDWVRPLFVIFDIRMVWHSCTHNGRQRVKSLSRVEKVSGNELSHTRQCLTHLFHCRASCGRHDCTRGVSDIPLKESYIIAIIIIAII